MTLTTTQEYRTKTSDQWPISISCLNSVCWPSIRLFTVYFAFCILCLLIIISFSKTDNNFYGFRKEINMCIHIFIMMKLIVYETLVVVGFIWNTVHLLYSNSIRLYVEIRVNSASMSSEITVHNNVPDA